MSGSTRTAATVCWPKVLLTAAIAVGGALAMTLVIGSIAMVAVWNRGVPPRQVPMMLTTDASLPFFCAAAGVFSAFAAGYIIAARGDGGAALRQALAASVATIAGHAVVALLLGSPLAGGLTAVYIGLTFPAVLAGSALAMPSCRRMA